MRWIQSILRFMRNYTANIRDAVIISAGTSGTVAGYHLAAEGAWVPLIERGSRLQWRRAGCGEEFVLPGAIRWNCLGFCRRSKTGGCCPKYDVDGRLRAIYESGPAKFEGPVVAAGPSDRAFLGVTQLKSDDRADKPNKPARRRG